MTDDVDPADVVIRDAATVALLTDTVDGLSVWLQQRSPSLVFAAGMFAFPGGAVDDIDRRRLNAAVDHHAAVWGCEVDEAAALAAAAVRETEEESGVQLSVSDLVPWSRWVTPPGPPRRFDARFFVAASPAAQTPQPTSSEVHLAGWYVVLRAVDAHLAGELAMWEPTITTLQQLAPFATVDDARKAAPERITAITQ